MRVLMVRVCLTKGSSLGGHENSVLEPLEFEYLAGAIPHHEVRCLDLRREPQGTLEQTLDEFQPEVVASTANTVDVYSAQDLFREVKRRDPGILTVIGGYHATYRPEDFNNPETDVIVQGPGELAFREIIDRFEKAGRSFGDIPGLMIPHGGRLVHTGKRPLTSLDTVVPDRRIARKYRKSYHCEFWMPCAMVRNTWGCPYRCNFCALWTLGEGKLWERNVEQMCDEIEGLDEKYVFFCDDLSFSLKSVPRMERFCQEMKRRNLRKQFYFTCRTDIVVRLPHLIEELCEAGMKRMFLGLEASTDDGLDYWNKHNQVRTNEEAIRLLHSHGVEITGSFLITPDYTPQQFEELFHYADRINILCPAFLIYTPHPGVHVHEEKGFGQINENYEFYDHLHTVFETRLPQEEFYRHFSGLWRRAYSPLCRTGYRRFWRILRRISLPLLPHTLKMGVSIFRRMAKGNLMVDRYQDGRMSNSGRTRLAPVESVPASQFAQLASGAREEV
ncbi:MAG: cobalamin B12-binding domain-containing protein [Acidobacteria bacterium]|nr:cobalamin B12-binding domain-containing protein [Acidobacteriota bacterium]